MQCRKGSQHIGERNSPVPAAAYRCTAEDEKWQREHRDIDKPGPRRPHTLGLNPWSPSIIAELSIGDDRVGNATGHVDLRYVLAGANPPGLILQRPKQEEDSEHEAGQDCGDATTSVHTQTLLRFASVIRPTR
jgi:hypothetical protein